MRTNIKYDRYVVKSIYLARFLMQKGIRLIKTVPSRENPLYNVWIFDVKNIDLTPLMVEYHKNKPKKGEKNNGRKN